MKLSYVIICLLLLQLMIPVTAVPQEIVESIKLGSSIYVKVLELPMSTYSAQFFYNDRFIVVASGWHGWAKSSFIVALRPVTIIDTETLKTYSLSAGIYHYYINTSTNEPEFIRLSPLPMAGHRAYITSDNIVLITNSTHLGVFTPGGDVIRIIKYGTTIYGFAVEGDYVAVGSTKTSGDGAGVYLFNWRTGELVWHFKWAGHVRRILIVGGTVIAGSYAPYGNASEIEGTEWSICGKVACLWSISGGGATIIATNPYGWGALQLSGGHWLAGDRNGGMYVDFTEIYRDPGMGRIYAPFGVVPGYSADESGVIVGFTSAFSSKAYLFDLSTGDYVVVNFTGGSYYKALAISKDHTKIFIGNKLFVLAQEIDGETYWRSTVEFTYYNKGVIGLNETKTILPLIQNETSRFHWSKFRVYISSIINRYFAKQALTIYDNIMDIYNTTEFILSYVGFGIISETTGYVDKFSIQIFPEENYIEQRYELVIKKSLASSRAGVVTLFYNPVDMTLYKYAIVNRSNIRMNIQVVVNGSLHPLALTVGWYKSKLIPMANVNDKIKIALIPFIDYEIGGSFLRVVYTTPEFRPDVEALSLCKAVNCFINDSGAVVIMKNAVIKGIGALVIVHTVSNPLEEYSYLLYVELILVDLNLYAPLRLNLKQHLAEELFNEVFDAYFTVYHIVNTTYGEMITYTKIPAYFTFSEKGIELKPNGTIPIGVVGVDLTIRNKVKFTAPVTFTYRVFAYGMFKTRISPDTLCYSFVNIFDTPINITSVVVGNVTDISVLGIWLIRKTGRVPLFATSVYIDRHINVFKRFARRFNVTVDFFSKTFYLYKQRLVPSTHLQTIMSKLRRTLRPNEKITICMDIEPAYIPPPNKTNETIPPPPPPPPIPVPMKLPEAYIEIQNVYYRPLEVWYVICSNTSNNVLALLNVSDYVKAVIDDMIILPPMNESYATANKSIVIIFGKDGFYSFAKKFNVTFNVRDNWSCMVFTERLQPLAQLMFYKTLMWFIEKYRYVPLEYKIYYNPLIQALIVPSNDTYVYNNYDSEHVALPIVLLSRNVSANQTLVKTVMKFLGNTTGLIYHILGINVSSYAVNFSLKDYLEKMGVVVNKTLISLEELNLTNATIPTRENATKVEVLVVTTGIESVEREVNETYRVHEVKVKYNTSEPYQGVALIIVGIESGLTNWYNEGFDESNETHVELTGSGNVTVRVHVIDEQGLPIPNANVTISYCQVDNISRLIQGDLDYILGYNTSCRNKTARTDGFGQVIFSIPKFSVFTVRTQYYDMKGYMINALLDVDVSSGVVGEEKSYVLAYPREIVVMLPTIVENTLGTSQVNLCFKSETSTWYLGRQYYPGGYMVFESVSGYPRMCLVFNEDNADIYERLVAYPSTFNYQAYIPRPLIWSLLYEPYVINDSYVVKGYNVGVYDLSEPGYKLVLNVYDMFSWRPVPNVEIRVDGRKYFTDALGRAIINIGKSRNVTLKLIYHDIFNTTTIELGEETIDISDLPLTDSAVIPYDILVELPPLLRTKPGNITARAFMGLTPSGSVVKVEFYDPITGAKATYNGTVTVVSESFKARGRVFYLLPGTYTVVTPWYNKTITISEVYKKYTVLIPVNKSLPENYTMLHLSTTLDNDTGIPVTLLVQYDNTSITVSTDDFGSITLYVPIGNVTINGTVYMVGNETEIDLIVGAGKTLVVPVDLRVDYEPGRLYMYLTFWSSRNDTVEIPVHINNTTILLKINAVKGLNHVYRYITLDEGKYVVSVEGYPKNYTVDVRKLLDVEIGYIDVVGDLVPGSTVTVEVSVVMNRDARVPVELDINGEKKVFIVKGNQTLKVPVEVPYSSVFSVKAMIRASDKYLNDNRATITLPVEEDVRIEKVEYKLLEGKLVITVDSNKYTTAKVLVDNKTIATVILHEGRNTIVLRNIEVGTHQVAVISDEDYNLANNYVEVSVTPLTTILLVALVVISVISAIAYYIRVYRKR